MLKIQHTADNKTALETEIIKGKKSNVRVKKI